MFQLSRQELPSAIIELLTKNDALHIYQTRHATRTNYHLPLTRTVFAIKTISYTGPNYWSTIDPNLKQLKLTKLCLSFVVKSCDA